MLETLSIRILLDASLRGVQFIARRGNLAVRDNISGADNQQETNGF